MFKWLKALFSKNEKEEEIEVNLPKESVNWQPSRESDVVDADEEVKASLEKIEVADEESDDEVVQEDVAEQPVVEEIEAPVESNLPHQEMAQAMTDILQSFEEVSVKSLVDYLPNSTNVVKKYLLSQYADKLLSEMSIVDWADVLSSRGVGDKKRQDLYDWVIKHSQSLNEPLPDEKAIYVADDFSVQVQSLLEEYPGIMDVPVAELIDFIPSNQGVVRGSLTSIEHLNLGEVSATLWDQCANSQGMGKKKRQQLLENLQDFAKDAAVQKEEQIKEDQFALVGLHQYMDEAFVNCWQLLQDDLEDVEVLRACVNRYDGKVPHLLLGHLIEALDLKVKPHFTEEVTRLSTQSLTELKETIGEQSISFVQLWLVAVTLWKQLHQLGLLDNTLKEREKWVIEKRLSGSTLEEVGEQLEVTRERVRQIEKKGKDRLRIQLNQLRLSQYVETLFKDNDFIMLPTEPSILMLFPYLDDKRYTQLGSYLCLVLTAQHLEELKEQLKENPVYRADQFFAEQHIHFAEADQSLKQMIDDELGIFVVDDYIVSKRMSQKDRCAFIVYHSFADGIYLGDDDQVRAFMKVYDQLFDDHDFFTWDEPLTEVARRIEGNMDRSDLQKIAGRTYKYVNQQLPDEFLAEVKDYVDQELSKSPVVYNLKLCKVFAEPLKTYGADDYTLYLTFKERYSDDYLFSSGRTMRIFKAGQPELTTEEIFRTVLKQNGGKMAVSTVLEQLGIEPYTVDQISSIRSNGIRKIGDDLVLSDYELPDELCDLLTQQIENQVERYGAVAPRDVLRQIRSEQPELAEKYQLTDENIAPYLKQVNHQLKGFDQFLTFDNQVTLLDYVRRHFAEQPVYYWDELKGYLRQLGYSESSILTVIKKEVDRFTICRIDDETYVYGDQIQLNDDQQSALKEAVTQVMGDKDWVVLKKWTPEALNELQEKVGLSLPLTVDVLRYLLVRDLDFKMLGAKGLTMQIDPYLVTSDESQTLQNILQNLLDQYQGEWIEKDVVDYLVENEVILPNKNHIIPDYVCQLMSISVDETTKQVQYKDK